MGLFGFGKKKDLQPVDLKTLLSAEEVELLVGELNTTAARVPGETSAIRSAMANTIEEGGTIPFKQGLGLCVSAINMNESFHEAKSGSRELAKKLEAILKRGGTE
jgi:hypothetical protein